jgi:hypothetical protein
MIIVRVELHSARDGSVTELARMRIANDGQGTLARSHYDGVTFVGRDTARLDQGTVSKYGRVESWPRKQFHVWNLVARMLKEMGYDK